MSQYLFLRAWCRFSCFKKSGTEGEFCVLSFVYISFFMLGCFFENVSHQHAPETKLDEMDDKSKEDEAQHKPKWMPPRHPG